MKRKTTPVTERAWYKKWYENLSPQERAIEDRERGLVLKPTIKKDVIKVYTDGCCIGNPGKGGYASIIKFKDEEYELSCGYKLTTNNRMELMAVIDSLHYIGDMFGDSEEIHVYSDSKYVIDPVNKGWLKSWAKFGYKKNKDLWVEMSGLLDTFNIKFHWIKGHNGHKENEECDKLSKEAAKGSNLFNDIGFTKDEIDQKTKENCDKFRDAVRDLGERYNAPDEVVITYIKAHKNFIDGVHAFVRNNTLK